MLSNKTPEQVAAELMAKYLPGPSIKSGNGVNDEGPTWEHGTFTAKELQTMTFPPLAWIFPDLLPAEGVAVLCSRPKLGKSWLAYDLCIACTMDRTTLGATKPLQGDVLYLALEDSKRRLQRRMDKLLGAAKYEWPEKLTIKTDWRRLHEGGLDDIRAWHKQQSETVNKPIMVVIDVLARVRRPTGNKPAYEADYEALSGLAKLANELSLAILVIHHTRKMAADDLMETVSGSFGLTGAADTILVMADKAAGAVLDIRGRDVESAQKAIMFGKENCRWTILGDSAEIHRSEQRKAIIAALKEASEPMTVTSLMDATGMKRNALALLLGRMVTDSDIKKLRHGLYAHNGWELAPPKPGKRTHMSDMSQVKSARHIPDDSQRPKNKEEKTEICQNVSSIALVADKSPQADVLRSPLAPAQTETYETYRHIGGETADKSEPLATVENMSNRETPATHATPSAGAAEDRTCAQCRGEADGKECPHVFGDATVWLHPECARFLNIPEFPEVGSCLI